MLKLLFKAITFPLLCEYDWVNCLEPGSLTNQKSAEKKSKLWYCKDEIYDSLMYILCSKYKVRIENIISLCFTAFETQQTRWVWNWRSVLIFSSEKFNDRYWRGTKFKA